VDGGSLLGIAVWLQPNFAVEQTAGSHALAAAAHRGVRLPKKSGGRMSPNDNAHEIKVTLLGTGRLALPPPR